MNNIDNIMNDYPEPNTFMNKLTELKNKLPYLLEIYNKSFVLHNANPEDNEYKQIFLTDKYNLDKIMNDLFLLGNRVSENLNKLNANLKTLYLEINSLKEKNSKLNKNLQNFDQNNDKTDELFNNYKESYEIQYLRNWTIALSIIISISIMRYIFKPTTIQI